MRVEILGIGIHAISMEKAINILKSFLNRENASFVVTPNPEIIMRARKDRKLKNIINNADLAIPDGIGVVLASPKIKDRIAGIDLIKNFFETGENISVYLLGAAPGIAEKAALKISKKYSNVKIVGTHHGFFEDNSVEEKTILEDINKKMPSLLLVGLGSPRQEKWIHKNKPNAKISIGCGGSLDVFSGKVKRAPHIFRKLNLEWLYRAIKEPVRFKRLLIIPKFLFLTLLRRF
ncbi:MAG: WecB/TagA/CpsF family glycosyltransferase [Defluviitaleaceae bacterium]|nr:WecB/TagA/CpsF family glycosyltransferase [Defluviitaleaceae bacterium]